MPQTIDPQLKTLLLGTSFRPAVTLWNRLEGRARKEDFERSLRAEVRDPLWMLTRQWQVGEFKGEDAGSAAKARVQVATARLNQFAVKSVFFFFFLAVRRSRTTSACRSKLRSSASRFGTTRVAFPSTHGLALRGQIGRPLPAPASQAQVSAR